MSWDARVLVAADDVATRWLRSIGVRTTRSVSGRWSLIVVDSYRRQPRVASDLVDQATRIVAIDDLHEISGICVDLLVRPSVGERNSSRALGGADYVLLRKDYWRRSARRLSKTVSRVLVALGGYADGPLVRAVVASLREALPDVEIIVVGGQSGRSLGSDRRIRFVGHVRSLRQLMLRADLAVTAGGQTMNEALACGTPTLVLGTAANQRRNVSAVARAKVADVVGWSSGVSWRLSLRRRASRLAAHYAERVKLSRNARRLIDGKGALRVARVVGEL
jgi:UDP-2,4-diacetamido-2,4,6-trideoxy-beta-L-altropyranose hydrolase